VVEGAEETAFATFKLTFCLKALLSAYGFLVGLRSIHEWRSLQRPNSYRKVNGMVK
jgi:hypothetical protein